MNTGIGRSDVRSASIAALLLTVAAASLCGCQEQAKDTSPPATGPQAARNFGPARIPAGARPPQQPAPPGPAR